MRKLIYYSKEVKGHSHIGKSWRSTKWKEIKKSSVLSLLLFHQPSTNQPSNVITELGYQLSEFLSISALTYLSERPDLTIMFNVLKIDAITQMKKFISS